MGEKYGDILDYNKLDPVKREALELFSSTFAHPERLGIRLVSSGETGAVFDFVNYDFMIGFNVEGLGTKNMIADQMYEDFKMRGYPNPERVYLFIGQDTAAMSVMDLVSVGADPFAYGDFFTAGADGWFEDPNRNTTLLHGYKTAADIAGFAIPCGETPVLPGIVDPKTLVLEGASVGLIRPKSRFPAGGAKIMEGDIIYGLPSNGVAANGISKTRKIAARLPEGYSTKLPSGVSLGDALLVPTPMYVRPVIEMFNEGLHYASPITGHGWEKAGRSRFPFRYVIDKLPKQPEVFKFLVEVGPRCGQDVSDRENHYVWNMGTSIVLIGPAASERKYRDIASSHGAELQVLGHVEKGDREVYLAEKNISYTP